MAAKDSTDFNLVSFHGFYGRDLPTNFDDAFLDLEAANSNSNAFGSAAEFSYFDMTQETPQSDTGKNLAQTVGDDYSSFFNLATTSATPPTQDLGGEQDDAASPAVESTTTSDSASLTQDSEDVQGQPANTPADDATANIDKPFTLDWSEEDRHLANLLIADNARFQDFADGTFAETSYTAAEQTLNDEQNMGWASPSATDSASEQDTGFEQNTGWDSPIAGNDITEQDSGAGQNQGWASPTAATDIGEQAFGVAQNQGWASPAASAYPDSHNTSAQPTIWSTGGTVPQTPPEPTKEELAARVAMLEAQLAQARSPASRKPATHTPTAPQTPSRRKRNASSTFSGAITPPAHPRAARPPPVTPSNGQGIIQAMWSPGVVHDDRRQLVQQHQKIHNIHGFHSTSSPAAMALVAPATPTPAPPEKKRRVYKRKDPNAPKKAPAPRKPAAKKSQKGHQRTDSEESIFQFGTNGELHLTDKAMLLPARPLQVIVDMTFDELTQLEKAHLLLPMLQGLDPLTGKKLNDAGALVEQTHATGFMEQCLANTIEQAGNTFQQAGNTFQQAGNTFQQAGNTVQQSGNTIQQAGNTFVLAGSIFEQVNNTIDHTGNTIDQDSSNIFEQADGNEFNFDNDLSFGNDFNFLNYNGIGNLSGKADFPFGSFGAAPAVQEPPVVEEGYGARRQREALEKWQATGGRRR